MHFTFKSHPACQAPQESLLHAICDLFSKNALMSPSKDFISPDSPLFVSYSLSVPFPSRENLSLGGVHCASSQF